MTSKVLRKFVAYGGVCEYGVYLQGYSGKLWEYPCEDQNDKENDKYSFARYAIKDGLIMGFFSIHLSLELIAKAKTDPLMQEICLFNKAETSQSFKGNFVDALMWIYEEQKRLNEAT